MTVRTHLSMIRRKDRSTMKLTRVTLATASSVLLLATLAACGGDDGATSAATEGGQAPAGQEGGQQGGGPGGGGRMPGASGTVAAISGTTLQVQNQQSGQVAVTWTAQTAFTQQVDAKLADVTVGSCVAVSSEGGTDEGDPVAATTVRITAATDDGCTAGFSGGPGGAGPGGGERPEGAPTDMPSDLPTDRPSDLPARAGGGTFGEVTAVSADGFTVESTRPGEDDKTTVDVTVSDDTTYTTNAAADSTALKVGKCVNATGDTDDTGAVTAERISVSDAVDGQCTGGFMIRNGAPQ